MRTIVLLPGMDGTSELFAPLIAELGNGWEVITVRFPATKALGYAELEPIAKAALPATGPYFLLGESFSGPLAIMLASARPPGLLGVVLSCSFGRNPRPELAWLGPLAGIAPPGQVPAFVLRFLLTGENAGGDLIGRLQRALRRLPSGVIRHRLQEVISVDVSNELCQLEVPVLYLQADADRLVPRRAAEHLRACAHQFEVVNLGGPHLLLQVRPREAVEAIERFARTVACSR